MKKIFLFLALLLVAGGINAQRMVQGVLRPELQAVNERAALQLRSNHTFSFDSINFWVGDGDNRAAFVLTWHDEGKTVSDNLVWGYRWDASENNVSGLTLFEAVMKADPRLVGLVQYSGSMGSTINGIGYNEPNATSLPITFDLAGAKANVSYSYPRNAATLAANAITAGKQSGVIYHPFGATDATGPAYDYDYWIAATTATSHWSAGWMKGYWSYFVRSSHTSNFSYSGLGASSRQVQNGTWDAWSWNSFMGTSSGTEPGDHLIAATPIVSINKKATTLSANATEQLTASVDSRYIANPSYTWISKNTSVVTVSSNGLITAVAPGETEIKMTCGNYNAYCKVTVTGARKLTKVVPAAQATYTANGLFLKNLEGYTAYISSISGTVASTFKITSQEETKQLSLAPGIYTCTAVKGTEKVAVKFVVK